MKTVKSPIDPAFVAEIQKIKTLKEIIVFGTKKGQDKRQFIYLNDEKKPEECTFNSTWQQILDLGTYMYSQGLDGKKKIAILSENSYQWIVSFYSILVGANIAVPMDIKLSVEDIVSQLVRGECDGLVYSKKCEKFADAVKKDAGSKVKVFMCIDEYPAYKAQATLFSSRLMRLPCRTKSSPSGFFSASQETSSAFICFGAAEINTSQSAPS